MLQISHVFCLITFSFSPTQIAILLALVAVVAADSDEFRGYGVPRVS